MFNVSRIISQLDLSNATIIALRHAEKTALLNNQPDYDRAITNAGQQATKAFAAWLLNNNFTIASIKTSPVKRCLQTAQCLQQILQPSAAITRCSLLGAPGAYVADDQLAARHFQNYTVREIIHRLWQGEALNGLHSLRFGTQRLLTAIYKNLVNNNGHHVYISHDAIWVPFITFVMQQLLPATYWLDYLQGFAIQARAVNQLTIILADREIEVPLFSEEYSPCKL